MPDANCKYYSAWSEINSRIQTRDHVLLSFISLTAVLVGIALSKDELAFTAIGVGYVALATALIIRQHDLIITHLAVFQRSVSEADEQGSSTPEWVSKEYYSFRRLPRYTRGFAHILFIVFGSIPALYISQKGVTTPFSLKEVLWYVSLICSIAAVSIVILTNYDRQKLIHNKTNNKQLETK
jgi:hypothetical protein